MKEELSSIFDISNLKNLSVDSDDKSVFIKGSFCGPNICPACGSGHIHRQAKRHRLFHLPPVGSKLAKLQVNIQRKHCVDCKINWWPSIPFANRRERMTHSFVAYVLDLLRFGTIKDVSNHLNIGWDTVKNIHKNYLNEKYKEIDVSDVEYVSIDEFSIAKRHKYMTIILDIKSGRILYAVEGRKKKDVSSVLSDLKKKPRILKL